MTQTDRDQQIASTIGDLLARRAVNATICPSEVARSIDAGAWRDLMEPVRRVAWGMVGRGELEVTQGGRVVDEGSAKGPIRLRLPAD